MIQYTLAIDRTNERLTPFNQPYHPAVLKMIKQTIAAGHRHGIKVGMCGEMAGDELMILFLLGAGLDGLVLMPVLYSG